MAAAALSTSAASASASSPSAVAPRVTLARLRLRLGLEPSSGVPRAERAMSSDDILHTLAGAAVSDSAVPVCCCDLPTWLPLRMPSPMANGAAPLPLLAQLGHGAHFEPKTTNLP
eukprot:3702996-Pyramimonas_sp.AAC.1